MIGFLKRSYPEHTWCILLGGKNCNYCLKGRAEFGELATWTNDSQCNYDMWVYGAETSVLRESGGKNRDEDEKTAQRIVQDVTESDMCSETSNYSANRITKVLESILNSEQLQWLAIEVRDWNSGIGYSDWSDLTNVSCVYGYGDKYCIWVSLLK